MSLEIISVADKGDLSKEKIILKANAILNLNEYVLIDKTFDEEGHVANLGRHAYKFPSMVVAAGDQIVLYTRAKHASSVNEKPGSGNNKNYFFYWGRSSTVWNQGGDTATLLKIIHSKAV